MDKTMSEWMEEWIDELPKPDHNEMYEAMPGFMRSELIARGIDPDSVYPIAIGGSDSPSESSEPIEVIVKFVPIPPMWKDT